MLFTIIIKINTFYQNFFWNKYNFYKNLKNRNFNLISSFCNRNTMRQDNWTDYRINDFFKSCYMVFSIIKSVSTTLPVWNSWEPVIRRPCFFFFFYAFSLYSHTPNQIFVLYNSRAFLIAKSKTFFPFPPPCDWGKNYIFWISK